MKSQKVRLCHMQVNPVPCPQSAWFSLAHALKQGMGSIQKPLLPDPLFINVGNHIMVCGDPSHSIWFCPSQMLL